MSAKNDRVQIPPPTFVSIYPTPVLSLGWLLSHIMGSFEATFFLISFLYSNLFKSFCHLPVYIIDHMNAKNMCLVLMYLYIWYFITIFRKMVLVLIGVQKNGSQEHIKFDTAFSWTYLGVNSSDFSQHSGRLSKFCSQNCLPHLPTMYPGRWKTLQNNLITFKQGQFAINQIVN